MKKQILILFCTLFFVYGGHIVSAGIFNPKEFTLANGMRCIVIENPTSPAVFHSLWVQVGGADEKIGQSGKAHFLEHLMFRGTEKLAPGQYDKIIHELGGENNAFTSQDVTVYHVKIAKENLAKIMEIEADRLTGLKITDDVFIPEKKVILEERQSRVDNNPMGLMIEQMTAQLYLHHPYRIPVIGWMNEIKELTREQVMEFYQKHYVPNNVILIVSGDVKVDDVKKLAEQYYGPLKQGELDNRVRVSEPPAHIEKKITLHHSQVTQPQMIRMYRAPKFTGKDADKEVACEVLAEILGGGQSSIFYDQLVIKNKQALGIDCGFYSQKDDSKFTIAAVPTPSVDPVLLEVSIDQIITNLLANGINDEELIRIKKKLDADSVYARDSLDKGAKAIGHALTGNGQISDVEEWNKHLESVTKEKVLEVARVIFDSNKAVTAYLRPKV
ncbi:MAG: pitrilysin family protein [Alphaproteobacteria bacterium]|nr:pitrilysin family protein [Alphaproteobacteria bacterium]